MKQFSFVLFALMIFVCMKCHHRQAGDHEKLNVVFIMADDLGKEWISQYGSESIATPHIDKLGQQGLVFHNAYSMPKCTPSRVALLTGQYPFRNGWINHWDVPRWGSGCYFDWKYYTTFASALRENGYATAIAGKWQINDFRLHPDALVRHGFDEFCVWTGVEGGNPVDTERYWNPYIHTSSGSKAYEGEFGPDVFCGFVTDFIKKNRNKPFMVYYPMVLPHTPFVTTPATRGFDPASQQLNAQRAMVSYLDELVGRVVAAVKDAGIEDRTVIIFTTDNGSTKGIEATSNGRKILGGKGEMTEAGTCVPFLVYAPGQVDGGTETYSPVDFTDIFPTLLELTESKYPNARELDGNSFAPLLFNQKYRERDWILSMGGDVAVMGKKGKIVPVHEYSPRVLRDKQYKVWVNESGAIFRLIDLIEDPLEEKNLLGSADPDVQQAHQKFKKVIASFPKADALPQYDPVAPQAWDKEKDWYQKAMD